MTLIQKIPCFFIFILTFGFFSFTHATPIVVEEHNFKIEVPDSWQSTTPPPPITLAVQSPDQLKTVSVAAISIPPHEKLTGSREMFEGAKKGMKNNGWNAVGENDVTINGLLFHSALMKGEGSKTAVIYTTSAGEKVYTLALFSNETEAENDAEIKSIAESFQLIVPQKGNESSAYRLGYFVGKNFFLLLAGTILVAGIVWFVVRKISKRSRRSRRPFY